MSKWLRLATLEPLQVPDAFGEMAPHLASFTNSPVDLSGSVSKPPSANQEKNITGERIEATQQRSKGDYKSFVFTGYFKKKYVFNFLWRQGLHWSLAGLEIIILIAAASFQSICFFKAGQKPWLGTSFNMMILYHCVMLLHSVSYRILVGYQRCHA